MKKLRTIIERISFMGKRIAENDPGAYSAQAAFFLFVSLFPFIMLLLALLQFLPFDMEDLIRATSAVLPNGIKEFVVPTINEIYEKGSPALISVTAVTTVWSASTGVNSILRGLARITGSDLGNWLLLRIKSIFYMLGLIAVIILSLGLFVFGHLFLDEMARILPHVAILSLFSTGLRWLCGICVLTLVFDLLYLFAPNRKSRFSAELPGAFMAAIGWAGFSFLYSFYVNNITNFSVYGSLTLAVFFLLWMYVCFYLLFIGAEINCFISGAGSKRERIAALVRPKE